MKKRVRKTKKNIKKTMDPQMPAPQNTNHSSFFKNPLFFLIIVLAVLAVAIGIYLFKKQPIKIVTKPVVSPAPAAVNNKTPEKYDPKLQTGPFHCPAKVEFCVSGSYKEASVSGLLAKGDAIYAVFDGELEQSTAYNSKDVSLFTLTNEARGLQGIYAVSNDTKLKTGTVHEGNTIGISSGLILPNTNRASFAFFLLKISNGISFSKAKLLPAFFNK